LCVQIGEHFKALGAQIGLKVAVIVGGLDLKSQVKLLNNNPHIVVGTPGKVVYHLENTKSFQYKNCKYLVFDEADKLLSEDFGREINKIIEALPSNRNTFLFSATMTDKVEKLERASLRDPVKVAVSGKYETVANLKEEYIFIPAKFKEVYISYLLNQKLGS
jgi:ATP-dependent RNA helicase DDX47/RRP3